MKKNKSGLCRVEFLKPGEKFEIPQLSETMRNMKMVSTSECSSLVEGQKREFKDDGWKPFRYHISNSVMVKPVENFTLEINENNKQKPMEQPKEKRGRGRPKKDKINLASMKGVDGEFTSSDLVALNQIKPYEAHNAIHSALKDGHIILASEKKGGRGKPQKVYKFI
jgi:hypothetical protein